ncbi:unnamed protein product [Oncorhynchus mykiss]|uniref:Uncharacterized protein n=1 Tax=Oncorhynchus mykiss TaxID=8022 RepID=A0A060XIS8_ONCMY|nr:unnamed protein product [Oncorhynchus mykiss]
MDIQLAGYMLHQQDRTANTTCLESSKLYFSWLLIYQKKKWSDEADAKPQDCFAITDWNMFWDSSDDIEECTTSVTGFINKCIEDVIPTVTVRTYPNQKPWITGNIQS